MLTQQSEAEIAPERTPAEGLPPVPQALAVHPFLFAAFAVTSLYAANMHETPATDVLLPLLVVIGLAAMCLVFMRLVCRDLQRAAIATSILVSMVFLHEHARVGFNAVTGEEIRYRVFFILYGTLAAFGVFLVGSRRIRITAATRLFNVVSIMLVVTSLLTIGRAVLNAELAAGRAAPRVEADDLAISLVPPPDTPDIYYVVFDRYASNETLREVFEFDNSPLYDQLFERGFYCAPGSHTNYPSTPLAMSAALNMRYHDAMLPWQDHARELENNRVCRLLKDQGYRFYYLGNWYFRFNEHADYNFRLSRLPTEFADLVYEMTPFYRVVKFLNGDTSRSKHALHRRAELVLQKFDLLPGIAAERTGPKFVYAHFLLPHTPYHFNVDGSLVSFRVAASRSGRQNYLNQLRFANSRMIQTVDAIVENSEQPPIIVIQSDEGPYVWNEDQELDEVAKLRKRTGIISAFHLPGRDAPEIVPAGITPVNTFRLVFREYFGANIELIEDRVYYWEHPNAAGARDWSIPDRFVDVTDEVQ